MVDDNTPLVEVVKYLPTDVAICLDRQDPILQELAIGVLRDMLVYFQKMNITLDPLQFEAVSMFVAQEAMSFAELAKELITQTESAKMMCQIMTGGKWPSAEA